MALDSIKDYMIGVILFVVVISGGVFFLGTLLVSDSSLDAPNDIGEFNKTLNKATEITSSVNAVNDNIQSVTSGGAGALGWINALFGAAFNGLQAVGSTLGFVTVAGNEAASIFGIPSFVVGLVMLIVVVVIGFAIWAAITRTG